MLNLQFSDLEQDIILLAKEHNFTKDFLSTHEDIQNKELSRLENIIALHKEYYRWEDDCYLEVIYHNLLEISYKFYEYRTETEFNIKYYLERIMQDATTGQWKEIIDLKHLINNLISCVSMTAVRKNNEDLFELKGKYVEG